jgi:hypothetical protein
MKLGLRLSHKTNCLAIVQCDMQDNWKAFFYSGFICKTFT